MSSAKISGIGQHSTFLCCFDLVGELLVLCPPSAGTTSFLSVFCLYPCFRLRRNNLAGAIAKDMGLWSREWAHSLVNWAAHIERGHDKLTWSKDLLEWHGPDWLDWQRLLWSRPGRSITNTRCCAGSPAKRWLDGLRSAKHALKLA